MISTVQGFAHFGEEPGGTEGGTSDHDGVHSVAVETLARTFRRAHIPVSYNRYVHVRVIFDFADECPIGFAAVHLRARTTVDGEFGDAAVLEALGKINNKS